MKAFSGADASVGLVLGSFAVLVFAVLFCVCRRVISFRDCMASFPEGFKAMVPAIMILCCAWTLKSMTDALGAREFVSYLIAPLTSTPWISLPIAIVLMLASLLLLKFLLKRMV